MNSLDIAVAEMRRRVDSMCRTVLGRPYGG